MAHLIGHVEGPGTVIDRADDLQAKMELVSEVCRFNVVAKAFHQFEPYGATGVLVLAESHFSAHTYPEDQMIYIDVFCCADSFDPRECSRVIERVFGATGSKWHIIDRRRA
jgi:S-adenosylmethionine decarboxylase proenzyme